MNIKSLSEFNLSASLLFFNYIHQFVVINKWILILDFSSWEQYDDVT